MIIKMKFKPCDCGGEYFSKNWEFQGGGPDYFKLPDKKRHVFVCEVCREKSYTEWQDVVWISGFSDVGPFPEVTGL